MDGELHFVEPFHSFFTIIILVMVTCFEDNLLKKCSLGFELGICKMGECLPTASPSHGWIMVKFCYNSHIHIGIFLFSQMELLGPFYSEIYSAIVLFVLYIEVCSFSSKNIYPDHDHGDILLPKNVISYYTICPGGSDVHTNGDRAGHPGRGEP